MSDQQLTQFMNKLDVAIALTCFVVLNVLLVLQREKMVSYRMGLKLTSLGIIMLGFVFILPQRQYSPDMPNIHWSLLFRQTGHRHADIGALALGYCALLSGMHALIQATARTLWTRRNAARSHNQAL